MCPGQEYCLLFSQVKRPQEKSPVKILQTYEQLEFDRACQVLEGISTFLTSNLLLKGTLQWLPRWRSRFHIPPSPLLRRLTQSITFPSGSLSAHSPFRSDIPTFRTFILSSIAKPVDLRQLLSPLNPGSLAQSTILPSQKTDGKPSRHISELSTNAMTRNGAVLAPGDPFSTSQARQVAAEKLALYTRHSRARLVLALL